MIVCCCTGQTAEQVLRAGPAGKAGTVCGGCVPSVRRILRRGEYCSVCAGWMGRTRNLFLGEPVCLSCGTWAALAMDADVTVLALDGTPMR